MNNVMVIALCQVLEALHRSMKKRGGFMADGDWKAFWSYVALSDRMLRPFNWYLWVEEPNDRNGWAVPVDTITDVKPSGDGIKFFVRRWPSERQGDFRQGATSQTEGALFRTNNGQEIGSKAQKNDR